MILAERIINAATVALLVAIAASSCAAPQGTTNDTGWTSDGGSLYHRQVANGTTCYAYSSALSCVK